MKGTTICARLCMLLLLACMVIPVHADTGPKPSVIIDLTGEVSGLEGCPCYVTLLSEAPSTGPYSSRWKLNPYGERYQNPSFTCPYDRDDPLYPVWQAFAEYEETDPQGLYFLGYLQDCTETRRFEWTYYPPNTFKLLLYFPAADGGQFVRGAEMLERYAFDSYYTADLSAATPWNSWNNMNLRTVRSYDYAGQAVGLAARVVLTIAAEAGVAWLFQLRRKDQLLVILGVNVLTQLALNIGLNWTVYAHGAQYLARCYLAMELGITLVEFLLYLLALPGLGKRLDGQRVQLLLGYAVAANVVSLGLGMLLVHVIPIIF